MSRVLVVSTTFPQYPGDPRGEFILRHWSQQVRRGASVRVLAPRTAWCHGDPGAVHGLDIVRFDYAPKRVSSLTGNFGILENIRERPWRAALVWPLWRGLAAALSRELDRGGIDRVVAHMLLPGGWIVARECSRRGVPFELFGHGTDVDVLLALPAPLRRRFAGHVAAATALRFPSAEKRARFVRACPELPAAKLVVEPMVHCVAPPPPVSSRPRGDGPPTVLYLGRLIPQKGVDDLFDAVARALPDARLEIAGDGPHRRRLQRHARRLGLRAHFHGFVHADAKHQLLSQADVVCVPSREVAGLSEGAPLVVREAFAYGVPVVATRVGGIPELRGGGRLSLVVPGDIDALGRALSQVLRELQTEGPAASEPHEPARTRAGRVAART